MKRALLVMALFAAAAMATIAIVFWLGLRPAPPSDAGSPLVMPSANLVERGGYLATAGNCMACHTTQRGEPYAGGRAIPTPFGRFYAPNITPDAETGIGDWSADDFWRAMHEGRGKDGTLLYPVFPYTNYTRVTRDDSDALYAYLRTIDPVQQPSRQHELRFPWNQRLLLVGWRALFFRPGVYEADPQRDEVWNRGAYLTQGLAHCSACHESRNALGAPTRDNPAGGLVLNWYAPALGAAAEAGMQDWELQEIHALLKTGVSSRGSAMGPMAEVVYESLQHLRDDDIHAMAVYLQALPRSHPPAPSAGVRVPSTQLGAMRERGGELYAQHCASCHGDRGEGRAPAAPALAGNRAVVLGTPVNAIRVLLAGGYPPGTEGNPRPFGMPPYGHIFSNQDAADVLTYIRSSWGNDAEPVAAEEVRRNRASPLW
jgi:mono/diheme cytochrome c family protein